MSPSEAVLHWRSGAREAWKWAERMAAEGEFQLLTPFSAHARYDEMGWVEQQATEVFTKQCLQMSQKLLSQLNCALEK